MSAGNFHSSIGIGQFPPPGDHRLPWLTADSEEGPDLLDRLVQQEKQERTAVPGSYNQHQDMWSLMAPPQPLTAGFISVNPESLPLSLPPVAPWQTPGTNHYSYSPLPVAFPPPPGSPASLHLRLEEAGLQLRGMKKERKRVEASLARHHPGLLKLISTAVDFSGVSNEAVSQPPHPTHLDRLVMDSFREYSKAIALLDKMKKMQKAPQHPGISASFKGWQDSILTLAGLRRGLGGEVKADAQIANYTKAVRRAKTSLWAALQHFSTSIATLPNQD